MRKKIIICVTSIIIYVLSASQVWSHFHKEYSIGGIAENQTAGLREIIMVFLPVENTVWAICSLCPDADKLSDHPICNFNWFFKVKTTTAK
jgi:hypothetical protein